MFYLQVLNFSMNLFAKNACKVFRYIGYKIQTPQLHKISCNLEALVEYHYLIDTLIKNGFFTFTYHNLYRASCKGLAIFIRFFLDVEPRNVYSCSTCLYGIFICFMPTETEVRKTKIVLIITTQLGVIVRLHYIPWGVL